MTTALWLYLIAWAGVIGFGIGVAYADSGWEKMLRRRGLLK